MVVLGKLYQHSVISFCDKEILSNLQRERKTAPKQTAVLKGTFCNFVFINIVEVDVDT